jgi:t-SNARE complex subunit (syntaxin)
VIRDVGIISHKRINRLISLWQECFEEKITMEHMTKIISHVEAFYADIIGETENRKEAIMERIESFKEERENLRRLLKEDVDDVSEDNVPLFCLQNQIDESLKTLREKLHRRREQINSFLDEQDKLCVGELYIKTNLNLINNIQIFLFRTQ